MPLRVSRISASADLLGESPVWDCARQRLYWVDGVARRVRSYEPASGAARDWTVPSIIGSVALGQGETLIVALVDGIYGLDLITSAVTPLFRPVPADPRIRFNDGKMDRFGRFLCGSMGVHADPLGQLFRIDAAGGSTARSAVLASGIRISNTLCFSPDGGTMYFADSLDRAIRAYRYGPEDAMPGEPRILVDTSPYNSGPDGATVDAEGHLWVALVQAGKIARFTPAGELDRLIDAPTDLPSCVAFGGVDLSTLYVTSIKDSGSGRAISRHADGGFLFAIDDLGVRGIPEGRFSSAAAAATVMDIL
jgi:sugar lactone lactonase YvrE